MERIPPTRNHTKTALSGELIASNPNTRIQQLEDLKRRWTADLQPLLSVDPERALHLVEALDDLARLIRRLEQERQS